jgi:hypothetical protein
MLGEAGAALGCNYKSVKLRDQVGRGEVEIEYEACARRENRKLMLSLRQAGEGRYDELRAVQMGTSNPEFEFR